MCQDKYYWLPSWLLPLSAKPFHEERFYSATPNNIWILLVTRIITTKQDIEEIELRKIPCDTDYRMGDYGIDNSQDCCFTTLPLESFLKIYQSEAI